MKTDYYPNGWLRILDIIGMVMAPISISLPFFLRSVLFYQEARSNDNNYTNAIALFFIALGMLILLGFMFGRGIKLYVHHQVTRDGVMTFRRGYFIFILGSLLIYFMIFYAYLFGP